MLVVLVNLAIVIIIVILLCLSLGWVTMVPQTLMVAVVLVFLLGVMMAMDTLLAKAIGFLELAWAEPAVSSFAERQRRHDDIAAARLAQAAWRRPSGSLWPSSTRTTPPDGTRRTQRPLTSVTAVPVVSSGAS